jgi:hypothetical protein
LPVPPKFSKGFEKGKKMKNSTKKETEKVVEQIYGLVKKEMDRYAVGGDLGPDKNAFFAIMGIVQQIDRRFRGSKDWPTCSHGTKTK